MLTGVPAHVDGRMLGITASAGGRIVNPDRMWHYTEGVQDWEPIWPNHGIRILPGPSSIWLDARGQRFAVPNFPGFDTVGTLGAIGRSGYDYSWFVLNEKIISKEFALSGSEQNPDLTGKNLWQTLGRAFSSGPPEPVKAFMERGADFVVASSLEELVTGMNKITDDDLIEVDDLRRQLVARDREVANRFSKDMQVKAIRDARRYLGDRLIRTVAPDRILDSKAGRLVAVRLNIMTRKTLGGLQTNLSGQVLGASGEPVPGLYAAGEVSGFGGGGMHGYRALEGTFLGGCIFSGRQAGRALADVVR
jgi:predicted oxidoreductase